MVEANINLYTICKYQLQQYTISVRFVEKNQNVTDESVIYNRPQV